MKRVPSVALLLSLLSLFAFALAQPSAMAAASVSPAQQPLSAGPASLTSTDPFHIHRGILTYHGGIVVAGTMNVFAIFWEPTGSHVNPNYNSLIMRYYQDVGSSKLYSILQQYSDKKGGFPQTAVLAGTWIDTQNPYPSHILSLVDIQNEVSRAIQANSWPTGANSFFPVFTASGIRSYRSELCGYRAVEHRGNPPVIVYAHEVYPNYPHYDNICGIPGHLSPNNCLVCDTAINQAALDQFNDAADPVQGSGWFWHAVDHEVMDECHLRFGKISLDNGLANQEWNGHFYLIQMAWSNLKAEKMKNGCTQG